MIKTIKKYLSQKALRSKYEQVAYKSLEAHNRQYNDEFVSMVIDFVEAYGPTAFSKIEWSPRDTLKSEIIKKYLNPSGFDFILRLIKKDVISFNDPHFLTIVEDAYDSGTKHQITVGQYCFAESVDSLAKDISFLYKDPYSILPYERLVGVDFLKKAILKDIKLSIEASSSPQDTQSGRTQLENRYQNEVLSSDIKNNLFLTHGRTSRLPIMSTHYLMLCAESGIIQSEDIKSSFTPLLDFLPPQGEGMDFNVYSQIVEVLSEEYLTAIDRAYLMNVSGLGKKEPSKNRKKYCEKGPLGPFGIQRVD
jgi:hypothetical protein